MNNKIIGKNRINLFVVMREMYLAIGYKQPNTTLLYLLHLKGTEKNNSKIKISCPFPLPMLPCNKTTTKNNNNTVF